ncbi:MAG: FkbM family methyltransferase [Candidatus Thiothrix putei]|uniref:FkbM family methyltransferase n=1 Tax=Candidatus Thiothrix putei TaxID=3080811 RepID=A0AA95HKP8_9GAMM|nr:MAG: FkbM family methyltransferase [Candidatus Thiothrix putei]
MKKLLKKLIYSMGYHLVAKEYTSNLLLAERLKSIIKHYSVDCIFDVGANHGQYGNFLRNVVLYDGIIVSFEPDPDVYNALLKTAFNDSKWKTYNMALGRSSGSLPFNIMKNSVFNSFLTPSSYDTDIYDEFNRISNTINVDVSTVKIMIHEIKKKYNVNRFFLKLDTQGYDLEVFHGATDCMDYIVGVQTEVSITPIYKNMPSFQESVKLFKTNGYDISGLYAVDENRFPHAHEFDCIYLPK